MAPSVTHRTLCDVDDLDFADPTKSRSCVTRASQTVRTHAASGSDGRAVDEDPSPGRQGQRYSLRPRAIVSAGSLPQSPLPEPRSERSDGPRILRDGFNSRGPTTATGRPRRVTTVVSPLAARFRRPARFVRAASAPVASLMFVSVRSVRLASKPVRSSGTVFNSLPARRRPRPRRRAWASSWPCPSWPWASFLRRPKRCRRAAARRPRRPAPPRNPASCAGRRAPW